MTKSVASAQEYLLHLTLLFCSDHDIRELIEKEGDSVPDLHEGSSEENPSKSSDQEPDAGHDGRTLRSSSRGATGVGSVLSKPTVNTGTSAAPTTSKKVFSAEEYEASCEGESDLQKWYARHNGLMFLSKENTRRLRSPPRARVDFFAERIMQFTSTVSAVPTASAVPVVGLSKAEAVLSGL